MTIVEAMEYYLPQDKLSKCTFHICLDERHFHSVVRTYANIPQPRPRIQIRDAQVKDADTPHFAISVLPPILPHQVQWLYLVINLPGANIVAR